MMSLALMTIQAKAQCTPTAPCTPAGSGYCTVPANNSYLVPSEVGSPFSYVIQVNTETTYGGAPINSMGISSNSLPAGLTATYNPASGSVVGGQAACILISGTPTTQGFGELVEFYTIADVGGTTVPITLTYYLDIYESSASLVGMNPTASFSVNPNPASNDLAITVQNPTKLVITDLLGKEKQVLTIDTMSKIDVSNWKNGVYFITNEKGETIKFLKH